MGNIVSSSNPAAVGIDNYVSELTDVQYERSLGGARFMKTIKCRHREGALVVKIFVKPSPVVSLGKYIEELRRERRALESIPNALFHQKLIETDRAAYSVRQHAFSSLYDRLSTRPFLLALEKKWISYQLLKGLSDIHARGVCHGDIKTENIMVTSWGWAVFVDFAGFKPVFLPEDNPDNFFFFFDTSARRTCYLAPERFLSAAQRSDSGSLTPAMDVFSLGCVLAELWLEKPMFDLSQLLRYRNGEFDPAGELGKIEDTALRDLILDMIKLDPLQRKSASDYLTHSTGPSNIFPPLFRDLLHSYLSSLLHPPRDQLASYQYQSPYHKKLLASEADFRVEKVWKELGAVLDVAGANGRPASVQRLTAWDLVTRLGDVGVPGCSLKAVAEMEGAAVEIASTLLATVVCSSAHSCVFTTSKLRALDLLLVLSLHASDDSKLDRILPFVAYFLQDEVPVVRATAVSVMTQLLLLVESLTPTDIQVFPEYILPNLRGFATDTELNVRVSYASCLSSLTSCAQRFLQMAQFVKKGLPAAASENEYDDGYHGTYDSSLRDIQDVVQEDIAALLVDPSPAVKRALLSDIDKLCSFLGPMRSNDVVLSHMITYLNDRDWSLRSAFFDSILRVGQHVGGRSLEDYVLPLMVQSLSDEEEFIVGKALNALTDLSNAGLLGKSRLIETVETAAPLLCHPSIWIRYGAVSLTASAAKSLQLVDVRCFLFPVLKPFVRRELTAITESELLEKLKPPLARILYDQIMTFAAQSPGALADLRDISLPLSDPSLDSKPTIKRLKELGLNEAEREKILALHPFIARASRSRESRMALFKDTENAGSDSTQSSFMPLKMLGVTPHTVFLTPPSDEKQRPNSDGLKDAAQGSMVIVSGGRTSMDVQTGGTRTSLEIQTGDRSSPAGSRLRMLDPRGRLNRPSTPRGSPIPPANRSPSRVNSNTLGPSAEQNSLSKRDTSLAAATDASSNTFVISTDGRPQNVIALLEKKAAHFFPPELELGKAFGEGGPRSGPGQTSNDPVSSLRNWKPEGTLVGSFHEHAGAINQVRLSPDSTFFATCSDDGTVKIWDSARLEQNVTNRSRLSLFQGGKVTSLAFCEGSHSVASASTTGSIHVSRIDCSYANGTTKYSGMDAVRRFDLPEGEHATLVHHYAEELSSILMYASSARTISGLDLRTMDRAWKFEVPPEYGLTTALAVDKNHNWFVSGTSMGTIMLWDIRFSLPLKAWSHPNRSRVNYLTLDGPSRTPGSSPKVTCAMEGATSEISTWNLESGSCEQVFCVIDSGNEKAEDDMNSLYGKGLKPLPPPTALDQTFGLRYPSTNKFGAVGGVSGLVCTPDGKGMISAGADRKVRFWDLGAVEKSYLVSTPDVDAVPKYSFQRHENMAFNLEYSVSSPFAGSKSSPVTPPPRKASASSTTVKPRTGDPPSPISSASSSLSTPTQSYHLDAITDIQLTPFPYPMLITTSFDGVVKIYK